jgi:hypothetical protein
VSIGYEGLDSEAEFVTSARVRGIDKSNEGMVVRNGCFTGVFTFGKVKVEIFSTDEGIIG